MEVKKSNGIYIVSLHKGDNLNDSLHQLADNESINAATVQGIGAVCDVELGYFDLDQKEYLKKKFPESHELVSCMGNIARLDDGAAFAHIHVGLGTRDYSMIGGHCFSATISLIGEIFVTPLDDARIERHLNDEIGLKTWNLSHCHLK